MAWDVIDELLKQLSIPYHPSENRILDTSQDSTSQQLTSTSSFINLLELFVDDFIGMPYKISQEHLHHFFPAIIIGIHTTFPPPEVSGHQGQEPISEKHIYQGEVTWETTEDILSWLFHRENFIFQLMWEKCGKIEITKKGGKWRNSSYNASKRFLESYSTPTLV